MKERVEKLNKAIQELHHEKYMLLTSFLDNELGEICSILQSIGFINESARTDTKVYNMKTNDLKGYNGITVDIRCEEEHTFSGDYEIYFRVMLSKYKSYDYDNRFDNMIKFEIPVDEPGEQIKKLRDTIKDEYQVLLRGSKLERILNEIPEEVYELAYKLLDEECRLESGGNEYVMPEYFWFKKLVEDKNHVMYRFVNQALREQKLKRIVK